MNFKKTLSVYLFLIFSVFYTTGFSIAQDSFFTQNIGQVFDQDGRFNNEVKYVLSLKNYNVSFYRDHFAYELFSPNLEDSIQLNIERIEVWFDKAIPNVMITPSKEKQEVVNVFKNGKSFQNIKTFESIYYNNVLDGVDIEFFIHENKLKYNYIISNRFIKEVNLKIKGGKVIKKEGSIYLKSRSNQIKETIPESYYLLDEGKKVLESILLNTSSNRIQYLLPKNRTEVFVIDPIAYGNEYSSYYGGSHLDFANSINSSKTNEVIVSGFTVSTNNIATTGAYQTTISDQDAFIASFDNNGNRNWATYFGGDGQERCYSAALDANDNVFITGSTTSQVGLATSGANQQYISSGDDAFIAKFSPSGSLVWSSYYGGDGHELITAVSIDDSNKIYVTGHTASTDLPCTANAYRSSLIGFENAFLGVFDNNGLVVYNSYYIKGSNTRGEGIEVTKDGTIYITGYTNDIESITYPSIHQSQNGGYIDGFLIKLDASFQMQWKTYVGGDHNDLISSMAMDSLENIYLVGKTKSSLGIATTNSLQSLYETNWDGFVVKIDSACNRKWGTYIQAGNNDELTAVKVKNRSVWLLGITNGNSLLIDSSAFQVQNKGGFDNVIINLSDTGGLVWSTYFGGSSDEFGNDIEIDETSKILIAGQTGSSANITTLNSHQSNYGGNLYDGFWSRFCKPVAPTLLSKVGAFTICEGDTININSLNSFDSYIWSNGETSASIAITETGKYILKTNDINNCPGRSDTLSVNVISSVNLLIEQSSGAICNDDSVLLSLGNNYSSYLWSNGDTTSSIYVKNQQQYSLTVISSLGCQYESDTITLTDAQYIYPILIVGDTIVCSDGEAILYTNENFPTVNWSTLEASNSITVNSSGFYYFNAIDTNGCYVISDTISITEVSYTSPSLVLDTTSSINVCLGDTVTLTAEGNFTTYEWSNGGTNQSAEFISSGDYYVEATDSNGCVGISDSVEVVFGSLPHVSIVPLQDTLCLNDSILISTTANLQSYDWSNGETTSSFYLSLNSVGINQLTLKAKALNNCYNYDTVMFNVIDCIVFSNLEKINNDAKLKVLNNFDEIEIKSKFKIKSVELIDYQGKLIFYQNGLDNLEAKVNVSNIKPSVYFLKVHFIGEKKSEIRKVFIFKK